LHRGLGLPVRRMVTDKLRTGIMTFDHGGVNREQRRVSNVHYEHLVRLGGPAAGATAPTEPQGQRAGSLPSFHWFWRSSLKHYSRHARIWHDWLGQTIIWWNRMRDVEGGHWMNGFERYDKVIEDSRQAAKLKAWSLFQQRCRHLIDELKDAALAEPQRPGEP
jgi:hypothetical protein